MDPLNLPSELTIYAAAELRPQWLAWLDRAAGADDAPVQAAAVTEVDGAGLQLLLALRRSLSAHGLSLRLIDPSPALQEACRAAGLQAALDLPGATA